MMNDEQTREIIRKVGVMCSKIPYQYNVHSRKREVVKREGLDIDEEEVEDLCTMVYIEDIFPTTYERKNKGLGSDEEEGSSFQIQISV